MNELKIVAIVLWVSFGIMEFVRWVQNDEHRDWVGWFMTTGIFWLLAMFVFTGPVPLVYRKLDK